MASINLDQINALYNKASQRKEMAQSSRKDPSKESFGSTLKQTIASVNAISNEADDALKSLSVKPPETLNEEIAQVGNIHQRIMEVQHNLMSLYNKLNSNKS